MYFQKDWLMRQIEDMIRIIAKIYFGKDFSKYEIVDQTHMTETDVWYKTLLALVDQRRLGEAEDLLFDTIDTDNAHHMSVALDFYHTLNALSDEELEDADFAREEVRDGLKQICELFGIPAAALL